MLTFPLLVVLCLALVYAQFAGNPQVAGALRGMGAVAAGLITATGLKLLGAAEEASAGRARCASPSASPLSSASRCCAGRWPRCCWGWAACPAC